MVDYINPGNELPDEIAEKAINEITSKGFILLDRILKRRPHRVALDYYMESIKDKEELSLEENG